MFVTFLATILLSPAALWSQRTLTLTGTPFQPDSDGYGMVTLSWSLPGASSSTVVEIHIGSPAGELFSSGGANGSAQTGRWVKEGTRFFLQDMSFGAPGITLATLTIHAATPASDRVHYIAAASTAVSLSAVSEPRGAVMLFDRETTDLLWTEYFPGVATPFATSEYGETLYVSVGGDNPGVAVVNARTAVVQAFIPLPGEPVSAVRAEGAGGIARLLVAMINADSRVAVIDPATSSISSLVLCPGPVTRLTYNRFNRDTYASMTGRQDLCVITPESLAGPPLQTPLAAGQAIERVAVIDNGEAGTLLISTWLGDAYSTYAIDLRESGRNSVLVPTLNGVYAGLSDPQSTRSLYGQLPDGSLQRFEWSFAADRTLMFEAQAHTALSPYRFPSIADERYLYLPVTGSCNTAEGPVEGCGVGFRTIDALTLEPRANGDSAILGDPWQGTILANRTISVTVAGDFPYRNHPPAPLPLRSPRVRN